MDEVFLEPRRLLQVAVLDTGVSREAVAMDLEAVAMDQEASQEAVAMDQEASPEAVAMDPEAAVMDQEATQEVVATDREAVAMDLEATVMDQEAPREAAVMDRGVALVAVVALARVIDLDGDVLSVVALVEDHQAGDHLLARLPRQLLVTRAA